MPSPQFYLEVQDTMICTFDASTSTATAKELGSTEIVLMDKSKDNFIVIYCQISNIPGVLIFALSSGLKLL